MSYKWMWAVAPLGGIFAATVAVAQLHEEVTSRPAVNDYAAQCSSCHGVSLQGASAPTLKGVAFKKRWEAVGLEGLAEYIRSSMPPGASEPLDPAVAKDIAAFVLDQNNVGGSAAVEDPAATPFASMSDTYSRSANERLSTIAGKLTPVTDAMLRQPAGDDWLTWRGGADATGYSQLAKINRSNVARLRLVWSKSLGPGSNGITPLAHDGVIFVHAGGQIAALDALTGDTIWKHQRSAPPRRLSQPRGLALYGNAVYAGTVDNHVLALDVRTGTLLWDKFLGSTGAITAAPLVANGKVFQGVANCARTGFRCFMAALDARTGDELWRFYTVPDDNAMGSRSWGSVRASERGGAGIWTAPSYRYDSDQVIFGTGNTYAVSAILRDNPKNPSAALFTNTTVSLDSRTGKPVWYFQHFSGDVWDMDWAYERMLITDPRGREPVVITMGKIGILDAMDQKSGKYLWSYDYGIQNLVTKIDPRTGAKAFDATKIPSDNALTRACPFAGGVRNWPATSYDPARKLLIIPALDSCMEFKIDAATNSGGVWNVTLRPGSDGKFGRVTAVDLSTGKKVWDIAQRSPLASSVLATAGGVAFVGSRDRWFKALDSSTGETLWQTRLSDTPNSTPITFAVGRRQFVAVVTGGGTYQDGFVAQLTPEIEPSIGDPTLWVFEVEGS